MQLFFMLTGIIQFNVLHSNIFRFNSYSLTYFKAIKPKFSVVTETSVNICWFSLN